MRDGFHDRVEVSGEFGVIAGDLLLPDPGEQNDLTAVPVRDRDQFASSSAMPAQTAGRPGRS
jgi:hypothetical protein